MVLANSEFVYAGLIVLVLIFMAAYVAWRQVVSLRRLRFVTDITEDERRFQRALAWRRLINSGLMLTLAVSLTASYGLGQERRAAELGRQKSDAGTSQLSEDDRQFLARYSAFWIIFGIVLLAVILLALYDMWAIRAFARRALQQIRTDRRAMIEEKVAELRRQRNGYDRN